MALPRYLRPPRPFYIVRESSFLCRLKSQSAQCPFPLPCVYAHIQPCLPPLASQIVLRTPEGKIQSAARCRLLCAAQSVAGCHRPSPQCCSASHGSAAESHAAWGALGWVGMLCALGPLCHQPTRKSSEQGAPMKCSSQLL